MCQTPIQICDKQMKQQESRKLLLRFVNTLRTNPEITTPV